MSSQQRVECPRCRNLYFSSERECPKCGVENEVCSTKFVDVHFKIEESLMIPLAAVARERRLDPDVIVAEAIEEWLTKNRKFDK